jgi:hypothetical protein
MKDRDKRPEPIEHPASAIKGEGNDSIALLTGLGTIAAAVVILIVLLVR